jgi:transcription elongation factor Elf1
MTNSNKRKCPNCASEDVELQEKGKILKCNNCSRKFYTKYLSDASEENISIEGLDAFFEGEDVRHKKENPFED